MNAKTFNMSLPAGLLKKIDHKAKQEYQSRSELIKEAIKSYLNESDEWDSLLKYGQRKGKQRGIKSSAQVNQIVRRYRHGK